MSLGRSLAHPKNHLPPAPAPTAQAPAPRKAHHAPPPAKAAQGCVPPQRTTAPHRHRAPVPLPPQPDTPPALLTPHEAAQGLKTGLLRTFHFLQGMHDQANDMVNPLKIYLKIYQGLHEFGQHEAAIYVPDPDGHTEDGDAFARKLGRDTLDSLNPFNKKSAYEAGRSTTNLGSVVVPGAVEIKSLGELRLATRATGVEAAAARTAADAAVGTAEEAPARAAAQAAAARAAQARAALRARLPGAGVRRAARQAGEKAQRARAAVAKYRERKAAGGRDPHDPWAKHTDKSRRKAEKDAADLHDRWRGGAPGKGAGQGQPALAHVGGGGVKDTSRPIGRRGVMMSEEGKGATGGNSLKAEQLYDAKTRSLARQHKISYDEASALKEVLESPSTKGILERDGIPAVGEDNIAKVFRIDRNKHNLPEFIVQRKDGRFSAVEVKNQKSPDIGSALSKFHDISDLVSKNPTAIPGMGDYRMGQYVIYTREGNLGFNDALFTVGKDGNLLFEGKEYRVDSVPVQVRERPLIPQDQTGGR